MKRSVLFLLLLLSLTACGAETPMPLEDLPEDYGLEQARADGVVLHEDGDIASGQEAWDAFTEAAAAGKAASVRLGFYYTLDDPSRYDPEYYASVKDDYPLLFIQDLSFDGSSYTLSSMEEGELRTETWAYMVRYDDEAPEQARYDRSITWVLLNDEAVASDPDMTYNKIMLSMASSRSGDAIPHRTVYQDYIYDT